MIQKFHPGSLVQWSKKISVTTIYCHLLSLIITVVICSSCSLTLAIVIVNVTYV